MATLTIRNLPDDVRDALRIRAARHGRSMEAEARLVLEGSVGRKSPLSRDEQLARMREAQKMVMAMVPPGVSLVDELIADRRREQE